MPGLGSAGHPCQLFLLDFFSLWVWHDGIYGEIINWTNSDYKPYIEYMQSPNLNKYERSIHCISIDSSQGTYVVIIS